MRFGRVSLNGLVNILLLLTCSLVLTETALRLYSGGNGLSNVFKTPQPHKAGTVIRDTSELGFKTTSLTVVIATASSCDYCTQSMPFYRAVADIIRARDGRFVGVTLEDLERNKRYLVSHGLELDAVLPASANGISVAATPMLLIVRPSGEVAYNWTGVLSQESEKEVVSIIERESS